MPLMAAIRSRNSQKTYDTCRSEQVFFQGFTGPVCPDDDCVLCLAVLVNPFPGPSERFVDRL